MGAWCFITCANFLQSNNATDKDLRLYKMQIFYQKTNSSLFFKKKGESDGTEERPQLVKFGHQSGPDSSGFEPTAFDSQQCRAFIYFELLTLCICSIQDEQTSVEINPGLIKLSPLFQ